MSEQGASSSPSASSVKAWYDEVGTSMLVTEGVDAVESTPIRDEVMAIESALGMQSGLIGELARKLEPARFSVPSEEVAPTHELGKASPLEDYLITLGQQVHHHNAKLRRLIEELRL